jgi:hypothetical protein
MEMLWQKDALFAGMTTDAFKLGTVLSLGWFWMRRAGCCALFRAADMETINSANILLVAEQNMQTVSPPNYLPHSSDSTYFYLVRNYNIFGRQERTLLAAAKVKIDSDGELAPPQPNKIFAWAAKQVNGNKVQLAWFYCVLEQKSQPIRFKIYSDNGTGQIDYENPLTTIAYKGRRFYSYQCDASGQAANLFAIRAENATGIQDNSLAIISIQICTQVPDPADIISIQHL